MSKFSTEITVEIADILKQGTSEGNIYYLPQIQLDRKTYVEVNTALENLGGKWSRKEKGHIFDSPPMEKINGALEVGETVNEKKKDNFFETPKSLAEKMVGCADISKSDLVLEPSAGNGALVMEIIDDCEEAQITAVELNPERYDHLKKMVKDGDVCWNRDFLGMSPPDTPEACTLFFDKIIMNPPFAVEGRPQADIDHVLHAYEFLKESGCLVAIMSPGFTFRNNKKSVEFKKLVEEKGFYEENDPKAFKESGTLISTVTVVINS